MNNVVAAFVPNQAISKSTIKLIIISEAIFFLVLWAWSPFVLLPTIGENYRAFVEQVQQGLITDIITSITANIEAVGLATIISLGLAYLTVLAGIRPIIMFLSKLRFLSLVGLSFFFTVATSSQHQLKLSLLVFSISVFLLTGMIDIVDSVPKEQYDLARTLKMGPWRTVYEVVILGQIDKAFDVLRQNAAIGWMMLTMVESMVRSEGGIGATMVTAYRHFYLPAVMAMQITIVLIAIGQDYLIGVVKNMLCPYSNIGMEKR